MSNVIDFEEMVESSLNELEINNQKYLKTQDAVVERITDIAKVQYKTAHAVLDIKKYLNDIHEVVANHAEVLEQFDQTLHKQNNDVLSVLKAIDSLGTLLLLIHRDRIPNEILVRLKKEIKDL